MRQSGGLGLRLELRGTAQVCCVHDREKRVVRSEEDVYAVGVLHGIIDPKLPRKNIKTHECSCCGNLFVADGEEPRHCHTCRRPPVHALGGPIPEPKGVVA